MIHFHSPEFGDFLPAVARAAEAMSGVLVSDSWWVNGRQRSVSACTVVEGDPASKKLPVPVGAVAAVLAACGKVRRTVQAPMAGEMAPAPMVRLPGGLATASVNPEASRKVREIVLDYKSRLMEIVERAGYPHDLPASAEMPRTVIGATAGPKKPVLERVFKPMGYSCKGGSGTFSLRHRTAANLTVELALDVGTWSHSTKALFHVYGLGFKGTLFIPVDRKAVPMAQYPIGDAEQWQKIVENMGAMVAELERTFVPEIEAAVGPSPEWYQPEK